MREEAEVPLDVTLALAMVAKFVLQSGQPIFSQEIYRDPEKTDFACLIFVAAGEPGLEMMELIKRANDLRKAQAK